MKQINAVEMGQDKSYFNLPAFPALIPTLHRRSSREYFGSHWKKIIPSQMTWNATSVICYIKMFTYSNYLSIFFQSHILIYGAKELCNRKKKLKHLISKITTWSLLGPIKLAYFFIMISIIVKSWLNTFSIGKIKLVKLCIGQ